MQETEIQESASKENIRELEGLGKKAPNEARTITTRRKSF